MALCGESDAVDGVVGAAIYGVEFVTKLCSENRTM